MNKSIAIFGGTFDPVHYGHIRSAVAVREHLGLSGVRLIPSYEPPHRSRTECSADHRLAMLRIAVEDVSGVTVDDREIQRQGISYTVDTLRSLREELADVPLCIVLGMDAFYTLDQWYEWRKVADLAHLVVLKRPGHDKSLVPVDIREWAAEREPVNIDDLGYNVSGLVAYLELEQIPASSTDIRNAFHRGDVPCGILPGAVHQYINHHGLYQQSWSLQRVV